MGFSKCIWTCYVVCVSILYLETCVSYSCVHDLNEFFTLENKIVGKLLGYVKRQEKRGMVFDASIKRFLEDTNQSYTGVLDDPFTTFRVLSRAIEDWEVWLENMTCTGTDCPIFTGEEAFRAEVKESGAEWPNIQDLQNAARAILHLWNVRRFKLDDIIRQNLLTTKDIFFIASFAKDKELFYEAIKWFEKLVEVLKKTDGDDGISLSNVYRRLATTYHQYGMLSKAIDLMETYLKDNPKDSKAQKALEYFKSSQSWFSGDEKTKVTRFDLKWKNSTKVQKYMTYEHLCRGELKSTESFSRLRCFFRPIRNSYIFGKVEMLNNKPEVILFHDVLTKKQVDKTMKLVKNSMLQRKLKAARKADDKRICTSPKGCNVYEEPTLKRMLTRISELTNLETRSRVLVYQPCFQVSSNVDLRCWTDKLMNYGVGGISKLKTNFLYKKNDKKAINWMGDSIATVIYQLSDVEDGGEIVFPKIKTRVPVEQGSVVFWWNLRDDGSPDGRTLHAHCPVVRGSKWVAEKLFYSTSQMFSRLCTESSDKEE